TVRVGHFEVAMAATRVVAQIGRCEPRRRQLRPERLHIVDHEVERAHRTLARCAASAEEHEVCSATKFADGEARTLHHRPQPQSLVECSRARDVRQLFPNGLTTSTLCTQSCASCASTGRTAYPFPPRTMCKRTLGRACNQSGAADEAVARESTCATQAGPSARKSPLPVRWVNANSRRKARSRCGPSIWKTLPATPA